MTCYRVKALPAGLASQTIIDLCESVDGEIPSSAAQYNALNRVRSLQPAAPPAPTDEVMIICGDLGEPCMVCGDVSDVLCDYPIGKSKTCDRALCERCTPETALDVHYCPGHRAEFEAFRDAGGVRDKLENLVPFAKTKPKPRP